MLGLVIHIFNPFELWFSNKIRNENPIPVIGELKGEFLYAQFLKKTKLVLNIQKKNSGG